MALTLQTMRRPAMDDLFSRRAKAVKRSEIRELLKLAERPEVISFAGGFPDPATFPHEELAVLAQKVLREDYERSLQYSATEGERLFREAICAWLRKEGLEVEREEVTVTSGSQQGLDLVAKVFLDPGDVVFCDLPTFLAAIQTFTSFEAEKVGIPQREDGMDLEILEEEIEGALARGKRPKLIYLVPDFHNPTGITMSLAKRRRVLKLAERYDLIIVEDNPYGWLRFEGEPLPMIKSFDRTGRVVLLLTFSKILCPGLRLGVLIASPKITEQIVKLKQPADLCTSAFVQRLAYEYMTKYDFAAHIEGIRALYKEKRDTMLAALERYMPKHPGIHWTKPQGGLFVWLTLPEFVDTREMFPRAVERNVAYVVGSAFFVDGSGQNTMRLAFSEPTPELIWEGIKRLGEVIAEELQLATAAAATGTKTK
jgi:2-aminoadipate transaminase